MAAGLITTGELEASGERQWLFRLLVMEESPEPVAEMEEEQVTAPTIGMEEGQMDALMMHMEEDLAALFGDDDFEDDASDGFGEEEVWVVNEEIVDASYQHLVPMYGHVQAGAEVNQVMVSSMAQAGRKIGSRFSAQALHIDCGSKEYTQIQQLQTTVTEMGSRESTLMRCILGLERRIAALERRPPGPQ
ncbi:hypothetical protein Tco_0476165 [Tanacetum coccineum]